jgi:DNA-binding transcriptional ArsR family regulator
LGFRKRELEYEKRMHPFEIMAEPIRRRIIEILASGEHSSGEITDAVAHEFGVTRAAISWHLGVLRTNKWVIVRPEASNRYYQLDPDALKVLQSQLTRLRRLWKLRIGFTAKTDPLANVGLQLDGPSRARPHGRAVFPVHRGMRGKGRRADRWAPTSKPPPASSQTAI